jgi:hypothetical protein
MVTVVVKVNFMSRMLVGTALAVAMAIAVFGVGVQMGARVGAGFPMGSGMMGRYATGPYGGFAGFPMPMMRRWGAAQGPLNLTPQDVTDSFRNWLAWQGNPRLQLGPVNAKDDHTITVDVVTKDKNVVVQRFAVDRYTGVSRTVED